MSAFAANRTSWRSLALGVCALVASGCAGLPRIDPSGERLFVWPQNQPQLAVPGTGSVQAPPVFTDPVFPQGALPATVGPAPVVVPVAAAPVTGAVIPPVAATPQDTLRITPDRILAPVGSEVVLRAGICTTEDFLLTDQKVEWLIARQSAGEIVDLGGKGCCREPLLPWNKPQKFDNQYAIGYTAKVPLLITRGTADPADDVKIEPGHSWASITSPVEGISNVTAVTSAVDNWATRRATATIYWVDVVWTFPPAQISASGSQVMTTAVRRQSDGTALAGWVVRYQVASGGELSGQSGQVVEVVTGADGRASIDVTPTGTSGSVTQINVELIRPQGLGNNEFPRLVVARGASTINWTTGQGTPYLPDLDPPVGASPAIPQPDRGSTFSTQPIEAAPAGKPALDLEIHGESQVQVGAQTRFEVIIRNQGNADATGVVLKSQYERGLAHRMDRSNTMEIENSAVGTLAAGQSKTIYLDFDVVSAGRLCHNVTVRCNEGAETSKRACINAVAAAPLGQPGLEVQKEGPRQATVGDTALFTIVVKNTGEVPLTNLEIVDEYDKAFSPRPTRQGYEVVNGTLVWRLPRLEVGASEKFDVQCTCLTPASRACGLVKVTDQTPLLRVDDHCMEILPRRDGAAAGGADVVPAQLGTLRLEIVSFSDPVRAGSRATYQILIANRARAPEEQVQLRVLFPPELIPDVTAIRNDANVRATVVGNELRFEPIAQVRADERLEFLVPVNVNQPGVVNVVAQLTSRAVQQPVEYTKRVEILGR